MIKNQILQGNVMDRLKDIPDESVQCCVTSPPYWGLRNYGTTGQIWGGDSSCNHEWVEHFEPPRGGKSHPDRPANVGANRTMSTMDLRGVGTYSDFCVKCGAWRGELGLEPTPEMYVEHLVEVFHEVYRVLRPDGTLWLNLGDSYAGSGKGPTGHNGIGTQETRQGFHSPKVTIPQGLKPKDLVGIPWRVAFGLQAYGWYLRSDIIWHKPNPMPESVTDRPTKSHEYIFLLSKSERYYYDTEAIREPYAESSAERYKYKFGGNDASHATKNPALPNEPTAISQNASGRNKRSVWTVATKPYKEAHFAVYPPELIEPCVLAGCPEKGMVLDPFFGSGTTGFVALQNRRNYLGVELNPEYIEIAKKRLTSVQRKII